MKSILYYSAVSCNLANNAFIGRVECRERTAKGWRKLWIRRTPKKYAYIHKDHAIEAARLYAHEIRAENGNPDFCTIEGSN